MVGIDNVRLGMIIITRIWLSYKMPSRSFLLIDLSLESSSVD